MKFLNCLVFAVMLSLASSNQVFAQTNTALLTDSVKVVKLKVKGITCSSDLKTISANVEKLKGVSSCKAGKMGTTSAFEICYNPILVSEKEINTAIESTAGCDNPDNRPYKVK